MKIKNLKHIIDKPKVEQEVCDVNDWSAWCFCGWKGKLGECGTAWESDGWENPEYQVAVCPVCGECVDF